MDRDDAQDSHEALLAREDVQEAITRLEDLMSGRVKGISTEEYEAALREKLPSYFAVREADDAFLQREEVQNAIQDVKDIITGKIRGLTEEEYLLARQ